MGDTDASKVRELTAEVERLRAELDEQVAAVKARDAALERAERTARAGGFVARFAARTYLSSSLVDSIKAWLRARKTVRDPLPVDETAEMLAAMFRRVINVGIVGIVVAGLPLAVLLWQSLLMREQNAAIRIQNKQIQTQFEQQKGLMQEQNAEMREQNVAIRTQNETMRRQVNHQAADTLIVRRAQLLDIIYECEEPEVEESKVKETEPTAEPSVCKPKAHRRARQEAVLAFVKIERDRDVHADLTRAPLCNVDLNAANLSNVNLSNASLCRAALEKANLSYANLWGAYLRDAHLSRANLTGAGLGEPDSAQLLVKGIALTDLDGANLFGANLVGAQLWFTFLREAILIEADLTGANFQGANLTDANLTDANLTDANLTDADLINADLIDAVFLNTILSGADLSGANLTFAEKLNQNQIDAARGNAETKLPRHLKRPAHWTQETSPTPSP